MSDERRSTIRELVERVRRAMSNKSEDIKKLTADLAAAINSDEEAADAEENQETQTH